VTGIIRSLVDGEHIFHVIDKVGVGLWWNAPALFQPRLELIFFNTCRTVSWLMLSTITSLDQFAANEPQAPAFSPFWFLTTKQGDQVSLGFSIHFAFLWPKRLGASKKRRIQSLLPKESADPLDCTSTYIIGFNDLRGAPAGTSRTAIHLE